MNIPGLGAVTRDSYGAHVSAPISVPVLGGKKCSIMVEGYDDDADQEAFHVAIANFLALPESALKAAEKYVFQYYKTWKNSGNLVTMTSNRSTPPAKYGPMCAWEVSR
jgi:hypothetical protein